MSALGNVGNFVRDTLGLGSVPEAVSAAAAVDRDCSDFLDIGLLYASTAWLFSFNIKPTSAGDGRTVLLASQAATGLDELMKFAAGRA